MDLRIQIERMIEPEAKTRFEEFTNNLGDRLVQPLFKIKELSEASNPYILIVMSIILLSIPTASYIVLFKDQGFMNFAFMQTFACLVISYGLCRQLTILPYLIDPESQWHLKTSSVLVLISLLCLVQSWNYWPRKNSLFFFTLFPTIEWCFEIQKSGRRVAYGLDN